MNSRIELWCTCGKIPHNLGYHMLNCPFERILLFDSKEEWWEEEGKEMYKEWQDQDPEAHDNFVWDQIVGEDE